MFLLLCSSFCRLLLPSKDFFHLGDGNAVIAEVQFQKADLTIRLCNDDSAI